MKCKHDYKPYQKQLPYIGYDKRRECSFVVAKVKCSKCGKRPLFPKKWTLDDYYKMMTIN